MSDNHHAGIFALASMPCEVANAWQACGKNRECAGKHHLWHTRMHTFCHISVGKQRAQVQAFIILNYRRTTRSRSGSLSRILPHAGSHFLIRPPFAAATASTRSGHSRVRPATSNAWLIYLATLFIKGRKPFASSAVAYSSVIRPLP